MKIALACQSPLLEKALTLFLKPYIVPLKQCDFVVCDHEATLGAPLFRVGPKSTNAPFPFTKSSLMLALDSFSLALKNSALIAHEATVKTPVKTRDFSALKNTLDAITTRYQEEILQAVKEYYEKP